jgi:hypothetical protein
VHSPNDLTQALLNLIRGTGVRRGSHQLLLDETDATSLFIELLLEDKFELLRIEEITIEPAPENLTLRQQPHRRPAQAVTSNLLVPPFQL